MHIVFLGVFLTTIASCTVQPFSKDRQSEGGLQDASSTVEAVKTIENSSPQTKPPSIRPDLDKGLSGRSNQAILVLMEAARQSQSQGDLDAAISKIERALRISPRYAPAYYRLAQLRYAKGETSQALQLAQKALYLKPRDSLVAEGIRSLIETCTAILKSQ